MQSVLRVDCPFANGVLAKRERMEGNGGAEALWSDRCGRRVGKRLEGKEIGEEEEEKERGRGVKLASRDDKTMVKRVFTGHDTKE